MIQKNNIIFLTKLYKPHVGGVEKHVLNISKKLISSNYSITIITEQFKKNLPLLEKEKNLTILRMPVPGNEFMKKFYIWRWFIQNFWIFKNADLIHIHDVFYWILPFRIFLLGKKIYITFHGYEGFPIKKRWIWSRKLAEYLTHGNICVGDFMKKWYGTKPDHVIYGASNNRNPKIDRFKKKSIIFFGRLEEQTNILEYAEGFKKLIKNDKDFKLDVFGNGHLKNMLKKPILVHKFKDNIQDELYKYEYVFVSRYLSMLEAMLSKRLIFAYYDNEVKKDYLLLSPFYEFVIPVASPEDLAEKVEYYSKNEAKKNNLITKGYRFASKQTWEKLIDVYLTLWKKSLENFKVK